jgi:hypothetical protein
MAALKSNCLIGRIFTEPKHAKKVEQESSFSVMLDRPLYEI